MFLLRPPDLRGFANYLFLTAVPTIPSAAQSNPQEIPHPGARLSSRANAGDRIGRIGRRTDRPHHHAKDRFHAIDLGLRNTLRHTHQAGLRDQYLVGASTRAGEQYQGCNVVVVDRSDWGNHAAFTVPREPDRPGIDLLARHQIPNGRNAIGGEIGRGCAREPARRFRDGPTPSGTVFTDVDYQSELRAWSLGLAAIVGFLSPDHLDMCN